MDEDQTKAGDGNSEQPREGDSLVTPLPQDNGTPFGPPTDPADDPTASDGGDQSQAGDLPPTHQRTDEADDMDSHELYDEGLAGAAEASEPNAGSAVLGYDPGSDSRKQENQ